MQLAVVAEPDPANGNVDIVLFVYGFCHSGSNKGLNGRNGKYYHENDEKEDQGEQGSAKYFPEFFDRYLCFNFANNINAF